MERIRAYRLRFNIAGPCVPDRHYTISAVDRLPEVLRLIDDGDYFVVHAARQSGKTTLLLELCRRLEAAGRGRVDIDVRLRDTDLHYPLELKLYSSKRSREQGLEQLSAYCRRLGATEGWLVLFDRRAGRSWDEKIYWQTEQRDHRLLRPIGS